MRVLVFEEGGDGEHLCCGDDPLAAAAVDSDLEKHEGLLCILVKDRFPPPCRGRDRVGVVRSNDSWCYFKLTTPNPAFPL